ncbi:AlbA family DNA-binding domain-containing protein [Arthrobacter sp. HY1533]|uniref:AlbA family DNA-binding domain-containing protein n=1 Tax=Arthrobacter sp. HY1533 TaxID=2970919 RepID=UPI0022B9F424|nr:hypothetical protein [Arthrobacter sp. HY1533]
MDWKQELPGRGGVPETSKDIAAMANSGGGVIVYGVAETSGRAESINLVSTQESDRAVVLSAAAAVRPIVQGMDLVPLASSADASTGVVVAIVPGSSNAPHLVGEGSRLGVPARNGATTIWLDERAIERAYSERFNLRASRLDLLSSMVNDLGDRLSTNNGETWLVGVATPLSPLSRPSELSRNEAHEILTLGNRRSASMIREGLTLTGTLGDVGRRPDALRVGRRRWIAETIYVRNPDDRSDEAHAEIHHDGSVGLAMKTDQTYESVRFGMPDVPLPKGDYQEVTEWAVEIFAADIVSLAYEAMQKSQNAGGFSLRIDSLRSGEQPFILVGLNHSRRFGASTSQVGQDPNGRTLPRVHAVESEILPSDSEEDLIGVARSIALEVVEQFGAESLYYLSMPGGG